METTNEAIATEWSDKDDWARRLATLETMVRSMHDDLRPHIFDSGPADYAYDRLTDVLDIVGRLQGSNDAR